ncbi:MAG: hypothetical protein ACOX01_06195 [Methanobrevibacter boviskoreani]|uniref:hypothetical protein n=1 Tax=Methanobrevibacter boviskoreani TaxID=1348249 RepID=UPI003D913CFD
MKDIYEDNNRYIITKEINGEWVTFGIFSDLNEAIEKRDELEDYGWPYQSQNKTYEKIEKYIYKKQGRFLVVKKILDKTISYGSFDEYDKAKTFKRKLIENAWNVSSMNAQRKYGKYIHKTRDKFVIVKEFNGKKEYFGYYKNLNDALFERDKLIDKNWNMDGSSILENIGIHKLSGIKDKNIAKVGRKFTVYEWKGDICFIYGFYSNHHTASLIRDKFIINKNIDYNILDESQKDTKYIVRIGSHYRISKMIDGKIIEFGYFDNIDEAIKVRNSLIKNKWDEKIINEYKSKFKMNNNIHKHIHKNNRGFSVVNRINGQLINFGTFNNLDEALDYRNYLEENDWFRNYDDNEDMKEEKYDEYIYLKNDGLYYLKYNVDDEIRIFGIFDNPLDAIAARLDCLKNQWDTFSISEKEYMENDYVDSDLPFGKIVNEDSEVSEEEIIYPTNIKKYMHFPVTVGKSYKNNGWVIKRSYLKEFVPILKYEKVFQFILEGFRVSSRLNLLTRLFYNKNDQLEDYLLKLYKIDPKVQTRVNFVLNNGSYHLNSDLEGKVLRTTIKYSKSFKRGMFVIPRKYSEKILPKMDYESLSCFSINDIKCMGRFNIEFRVSFSDDQLQEYLENNKEDNEELDVTFLL